MDFPDLSGLMSDKRKLDLETKIQLARIEKQLSALIDHFKIDVDLDSITSRLVSREVYELIVAGEEIKAIKAHRTESGASLAEAKETFDAIRSEIRRNR